MPGFMDFMSGNSDLLNKLKSGGYSGGNISQPPIQGGNPMGAMGVTGGNIGTPVPLGGGGIAGGNMPDPNRLPPGVMAPPPGLNGPAGTNLPGGPMGGMTKPMNPMRKIINRGPGMGVNPGPTNGALGGNRGLTTGPLGARPPMNSTVPPTMRSGGIGGMAPRPAQRPGMRKMRGRGGMSMF